MRLSAKILSGIYIEADTHFDRVYHWNGSGSISFHFPLGKKPKRNNSKTSTAQQALARRVHERPIRNEIIPMCKKSKKELLRDADGHLFNILFVNNLNGCPGVGTFEDPFCSTALAEASSTSNNHMIYIFTGDGTSNNYNTGFTMDPGQRLQGSAFPFDLLGVHVPNQTTTGFPILTSAPGTHVITAASDTIIAGLLIRTPDHTSMGINANGVTSVFITNNRLEGTIPPHAPPTVGQRIIRYDSTGGNVVIVHNEFIFGESAMFSSSNGVAVHASIKNNLIRETKDGAFVNNLDTANARVNFIHNQVERSRNDFHNRDVTINALPGHAQIRQNTITSDQFTNILATGSSFIILNNTTINRDIGSGNSIGINYFSDPLGVVIDNEVHHAHILHNTCTNLDATSASPVYDIAHIHVGAMVIRVEDNVAIAPPNGTFDPITLRSSVAGTTCSSMKNNITQQGITIDATAAGSIINVRSTDGLLCRDTSR